MKYRLSVLPLILLTGAASAADPTSGEKLANRWCAECHDIAGDSTSDRAPGWRTIVNERKRSADYIRTFLLHPHGAMPPIQLSRREIDDLLAYITSLKAE